MQIATVQVSEKIMNIKGKHLALTRYISKGMVLYTQGKDLHELLEAGFELTMICSLVTKKVLRINSANDRVSLHPSVRKQLGLS